MKKQTWPGGASAGFLFAGLARGTFRYRLLFLVSLVQYSLKHYH